MPNGAIPFVGGPVNVRRGGPLFQRTRQPPAPRFGEPGGPETPYTGLFGSTSRASRRLGRQAYRELPGRYKAAQELQERETGYFEDPTQFGRQFLPFFQEAAQGITDPALRGFQMQLGDISADVSRRFGGNVSSEELRQSGLASDVFTRNLTEALARLAPEAAQLGVGVGGQLGAAAGRRREEQDRLLQYILAATQAGRSQGGGALGVLGTLAPIAAAAL